MSPWSLFLKSRGASCDRAMYVCGVVWWAHGFFALHQLHVCVWSVTVFLSLTSTGTSARTVLIADSTTVRTVIGRHVDFSEVPESNTRSEKRNQRAALLLLLYVVLSLFMSRRLRFLVWSLRCTGTVLWVLLYWYAAAARCCRSHQRFSSISKLLQAKKRSIHWRGNYENTGSMQQHNYRTTSTATINNTTVIMYKKNTVLVKPCGYNSKYATKSRTQPWHVEFAVVSYRVTVAWSDSRQHSGNDCWYDTQHAPSRLKQAPTATALLRTWKVRHRQISSYKKSTTIPLIRYYCMYQVAFRQDKIWNDQ